MLTTQHKNFNKDCF